MNEQNPTPPPPAPAPPPVDPTPAPAPAATPDKPENPKRFAIWDKTFEKFGPNTFATKAEATKAAKALAESTGDREFTSTEIREV